MRKNLVTTLVMGFFIFSMLGAANATTIFVDDFEDGDALDWNATVSGNGSTGVEEHNDTMMAFAYQRGSIQHSLSHDFDYSDNAELSFDMHAVAYTNTIFGTIYNSSSGVKLSFLDSMNSPIDSVALIYATDASWLDENDSPVDNTEHTYSNLMKDYAALAKIEDTDSISTLSILFFAEGSEHNNSYESNSTVWFDNVTVTTNAVPVPGAIWLFSSGLIALGVFRKKK